MSLPRCGRWIRISLQYFLTNNFPEKRIQQVVAITEIYLYFRITLLTGYLLSTFWHFYFMFTGYISVSQGANLSFLRRIPVIRD